MVRETPANDGRYAGGRFGFVGFIHLPACVKTPKLDISTKIRRCGGNEDAEVFAGSARHPGFVLSFYQLQERFQV